MHMWIRQIKWRSVLLRLVLLTAGSIVNAISVIVFMAPFNIAPGGVSGLSVILNKVINIGGFIPPIGLMILIGNVPIQVAAYRLMGGWKVVAGTVYFVVVYSLAIDWLPRLVPLHAVSDNVLLNALFGGIVGGLSAGMVYLAGATLGGTSTLARILQQKYGMSLSASSLYTDLGVFALAGLVFGWEAALYAIVALFVGALASDYVLEGPSVIRTAFIITDHPREVADAVLSELGRGVTAWQGTGMFTEQPHTVLFVTIARPQVNVLREIVASVDSGAFIVIGQGHVAYGHGFKEVKMDDAAAAD